MPSEVYRYQRTGDFVFCRGSGPLSHALRFAQKYVDGVAAPFSHAAMCINPGLLIHSTPGGGSHLLKIETQHPDAIDFDAVDDVAVLRLPAWPVDALALVQAMLFWTGQAYNFSFLRPVEGVRGRAYCSQLLLQILDRAGIEVPILIAGRPITPSGLYRALERLEAEDVTDAYRTYARLWKANSHERRRLLHDIPREMIFRAARHNIEQAVARRTLTRGIAQTTAAAALSLAEVAAGVRALRGVARPLEEVSRDLIAYLKGVDLLFTMSSLNSDSEATHYLDLIGAPAVVISGMLLYPAQLQAMSDEIRMLIDEFAALCDFLFLIEQQTPLPSEQAVEFVSYCERRLDGNCAIDAAPAEAALRAFPHDLDAVVTRERQFEPIASVLRQTGDRLEALGNMENALRAHIRNCRKLPEGGMKYGT